MIYTGIFTFVANSNNEIELSTYKILPEDTGQTGGTEINFVNTRIYVNPAPIDYIESNGT